MEFEYDPAKSRTNAQKHGIDFEQAKALWNDPRAVSIPVWSEDEPRFALVAEWNEKVTRPGGELLRVQLELPLDLLQKIEREAAKRGMTREALMTAWLGEKAG